MIDQAGHPVAETQHPGFYIIIRNTPHNLLDRRSCQKITSTNEKTWQPQDRKSVIILSHDGANPMEEHYCAISSVDNCPVS